MAEWKVLMPTYQTVFGSYLGRISCISEPYFRISDFTGGTGSIWSFRKSPWKVKSEVWVKSYGRSKSNKEPIFWLESLIGRAFGASPHPHPIGLTCVWRRKKLHIWGEHPPEYIKYYHSLEFIFLSLIPVSQEGHILRKPKSSLALWKVLRNYISFMLWRNPSWNV